MSKRRKLFISDYCLTPYQYIPNPGILCEKGKILAVGGKSAFSEDDDLDIVDLTGSYVVPGFIDSHIHGAGGFDSSTAYDPNNHLRDMSKTLARHGVTTFIPTIVSSGKEKMLKTIDALTNMIDGELPGAEAAGIHLEGPFLNKRKHGSQDRNDIVDIDLGLAQELITAGKGKIRTVTFAPELNGAVELVEMLREHNISPSMGHSDAQEDDVRRSVDAGACRCTHLFNGMPPLHQRKMNLTSMALTDDRITIELILDGAHINPNIVDLACRIKPKNKIVGVSDAIQGAGLSDGRYHIGNAEVKVKDGMSTTMDGILAGTTMTLEIGWQHLITYSHLDRTDSAACFSINAALDLGLRDRGEITPGKRADLAFFHKDDNTPRMTIRRGEIIYDGDKVPSK